VTLALLEQKFHDIDIDPQRLRNWYAVERRRTYRRLAKPELCGRTHRDDVRNESIAIHHGDALTAPDRAKVLAQVRLELGDADLLHDLMMTRPGHHAQEVWRDEMVRRGCLMRQNQAFASRARGELPTRWS